MAATTTGANIRKLASLADFGLCPEPGRSLADPCQNVSMTTEWQKWVGVCATKGHQCEQQDAVAMFNLHKARRKLKEGVFSKFDVLVFTQKVQALMRASKDGDLFLNDFGSSFAYPSLTIPIGFTKSQDEPALPVNAYFVTTPERTPLMLSVAKKYEQRFWTPKLPENFR